MVVYPKEANLLSNKIQSRSQRNKNNNNRSDLVLKLSIGLLVIAIFILLLEFIYPGSNSSNEADLVLGSNEESESVVIDRESSEESEEDESIETVESDETEESSESEAEISSEVTSEESDADIREIPSNDPNVIKAYAADWEPIGTTQSGTHVTDYNDGSADRIEIKRAASQATGVPEDDIVEYWVGNAGEQRVTATIMQVSTGKYFKTYLTWNDGKGWQVTRYDEIRTVVQ